MSGTAGSRPGRKSVEQVAVNTAQSALAENITRFNRTVPITALLAGTAVNILTDTTTNPTDRFVDVPAGYTVVIEGWRIKVKGTTAWSGGSGTFIQIELTDGTSIVKLVSAGLTSQNYLLDGSSNITLSTIYTNSGGRLTAGFGLQVKGDANYGAGSDVQVTVWGYTEKMS